MAASTQGELRGLRLRQGEDRERCLGCPVLQALLPLVSKGQCVYEGAKDGEGGDGLQVLIWILSRASCGFVSAADGVAL